MFARVFTLLPLALLASASHGHLEARSACNEGSISCCNSLQSAKQANSILAPLGLVSAAANAGGLVGFSCSPLSVAGLGNGCQANQQTVCCNHNNYNGVIVMGCSNVNTNV